MRSRRDRLQLGREHIINSVASRHPYLHSSSSPHMMRAGLDADAVAIDL